MESVKIRLERLLTVTPNLCEERTLQSIGEELGVTRERIRQLLPVPPKSRHTIRAQNRWAADSRKLAAYVEEHPNAVLPVSRGGMSFAAIARDLGFNQHRLTTLWRLCEYPPRTLLFPRRTSAEQQRHAYATSAKRRAYLKARVDEWRAANRELWNERCRESGARYRARKKAGLVQDRRVVKTDG